MPELLYEKTRTSFLLNPYQPTRPLGRGWPKWAKLAIFTCTELVNRGTLKREGERGEQNTRPKTVSIIVVL